MPLPSSVNRGRVSATLGRPIINQADYTAKPDVILQSMSNGVKLADQLSDAVILRPRQVNAAGAAADANKEIMINAGQAAMADRSNIDIRAANAGQVLGTDSVNNASSRILADLQNKGMNDPATQSSILQAFKLGAETTKLKAQTDNIGAAGEVDLAPGNVKIAKYQQGGALEAAPELASMVAFRAREEAARAPTEESTKTIQAKKNNADAVQLNRFASDLDLRDMEFNAVKNVARVAQQNSKNQVDLHNKDYDRNVVQQGQDTQSVATDAARRANLVVTNPVVGAAADVKVAADIVSAGMESRANLARQIMLAESGAAGRPLSPDEEKEIRVKAQEAGVVVADGQGVRPIAEVAQQWAEKVRLKEALPLLAEVKKESDGARLQYNTLVKIKAILPETSTGNLWSVPGTKILSNLVSGRFDTVANNQLLEALKDKLTVDKAGGKLGNGVSNTDIKKIAASFPGVDYAKTNNIYLTAAAMAITERQMQQHDFLATMVPKMGGTEAQLAWDNYQNSNPLIDEIATKDGKVGFEKLSMSPEQYLAAVKDPQLGKNNLSKTAQANKDSLPYENVNNPGNLPFVVEYGTNKLKENPNYWTKIQDLHDKMYPVSVAPALNRSKEINASLPGLLNMGKK